MQIVACQEASSVEEYLETLAREWSAIFEYNYNEEVALRVLAKCKYNIARALQLFRKRCDHPLIQFIIQESKPRLI